MAGVLRHLIERIKAIPREVEQTAIGKIAQGSTELGNALYTGHAYSPYTADTAAYRAQFQNRDQGKGLER